MAVFSLLFEVADKSLKVADSAIHDTCGGEGVWQGECYRRVADQEVRADGERTPDTEYLKEMQSI